MIEGSAAASDLTWGGMVQLSGANGKGIQTSSGELIVPTCKDVHTFGCWRVFLL